tara:strand:+ start:136 stop:939 length:804 start_codon:yes stop_codon:yes gene_type:complete
MIKLTDLLIEVKKKRPLAIFLAGSAGSGKSSFRKTFIDPIGKFMVLNLDDEYEPLLKKAKIPLDFRKYTSPEQLSKAAQAMAGAQVIHKKKYEDIKSAFQNVVIDGTGGSSSEIAKKKKELEDLGYKTLMALIFVPPDISLARNIKRGDEGGRTLMPSIILRTWSSLFNNIKTYKQMFGDDLVVYKAFGKEDTIFKDFDPEHPEVKKMFFDPFKVKGKEKSPEEKAKSAQKIKDLNDLIRTQVKNIGKIDFDDPQEIQNKIRRFTNA